MKHSTKTGLVAAAGLAFMLAGGVAAAQVAAPPPPPPPGADGPPGGPPGGPMGEGMRHGPGHHGRMAEMMRMRPPPPPSKAAHFNFRKGDARVDIKCADDEPMKACVDAGMALLDKLAAQPK